MHGNSNRQGGTFSPGHARSEIPTHHCLEHKTSDNSTPEDDGGALCIMGLARDIDTGAGVTTAMKEAYGFEGGIVRTWFRNEGRLARYFA